MNKKFQLSMLKTLLFGLLSFTMLPVFAQDDNSEIIPPGFGKVPFVLLVIEKGKESFDKYLEDNFANNYNGQYELLSDMDELNNKKYADVKKYRYYFAEDFHAYGGGGDGLNMYSYFIVVDRMNGDVYKTKHASGAFSKLMKSYIKELEKARVANGGK
jgi:hypothetical protein